MTTLTVYDVLDTDLICQVMTFQACLSLDELAETDIAAWLHDAAHVLLNMGISNAEEMTLFFAHCKAYDADMVVSAEAEAVLAALPVWLVALMSEFPLYAG